MSSKIDERVVSMKFDSKQFQSGVAETSSALDKLKAALNLSGASKGFDDLNAKANNTNLSGLTNGIAEASSRFSGLQVVGIAALAAIAAKAVVVGQSLVQSMGQSATAAMSDGWKDYNSKLTSVQTIMNATGASIDVVNGYFNELDTYADKTVYNLNDMTGAFAKFTNAGVGMDKSVPAIKGIANMVALAGQGANEAQIAMYNLSQSIAGGFLTTTDYKSLNLANVATAEWKNNMILAAVAAGKLQDLGGGAYHIVGTKAGSAYSSASLFNEALSEGWASSEVLLGVLGDYGDATTDIGKKALAAAQNVKSLPMMMETLAASAGTGWTSTFETIFGNVTQATALFTMLTTELQFFTDESSNTRNAQLELWAEMGGRDALVEALSNAFAALHSVLTPIKEAFNQVFPPSLGKTLAAISIAIRDFTKGLILSENAQANLKMVAVAVFSVLKFGIDIIKGVASVISFLVGLVFNLVGAMLSLIGPVLTFVRSLMPVSEGADQAASSVDGFFGMLVGAGKFLTGWLPDAIRNLGTLLNDFLNDGTVTKNVKAFMSALSGLGDAAKSVWSILSAGDFKSNPLFEEDSTLVVVLLNIRKGIMSVVDAFKDFSSGISEAAGRAQGFWAGVGEVVNTVWEAIKPIVNGVKKFFGDIMKSVDLETIMAGINAGFLVGLAVAIGRFVKTISDAFGGAGDLMAGLGDTLKGLVGVLEQYQKNLKADMLLKIAGAIAVLAGALWVLSTIDPARLASAVAGMATSFGILLGGLALLDKIDAEPSLRASVALTLIAAAVSILATAVQKMGQLDPAQLATGLVGIAAAMAVLVGAAKLMSGIEGDILKSSFAMTLMAGAILVMASAVGLFGVMPIEVITQGMTTVGIVLAALVGSAVLLSKFAPTMVLSAVGLIAMAFALSMLVAPLTLLGLLPFPVLLQGMVSLGIILAALVGAALLLGLAAPTMVMAAVGLLAMAAAINLLVAPITILGALPMDTLVQGITALAVVLGVLVLAALAMTGAAAGAVGMIAMSAAILLLSIALAVLAAIDPIRLGIAILGLVVAIVALAITSAILTPLIPVMAGVAGVMALFALGALALAIAVVVLAFGLGLMGPGLASATEGLLKFAAALPDIILAAPAMVALGVGFLAFGAGALVAGAGALVLGLGLVVLGVGLALISAVGVLGAFAMKKVAEAAEGLFLKIPAMLAVGAAFLVLGAGVVLLGAGLLVLAIGAISVSAALAMLIPMGALVTLAFNLIIKAVERLVPMVGELNTIGKAFAKLGDAVVKLADNGRAAASGLMLMSTSFTSLSTGAALAGTAVQTLAARVGPSITAMIISVQRAPAAFQAFAIAVITSITFMNAGLSSGSAQALATASRLGSAVGGQLVGGISSSYGSVYNASVTLGSQMTAGMNRGLQNGSASVSAMAAQVARTALTAAKRTLGVASPSKEFTKIGAWSDEGLVNGMLNNIGTVEKAGSTVGNVALKSVQNALSELKNSVAVDMDIAPTIKPVLDLSAIRKDSSLIGGLISPPSLKVSDSYAMASSLASQQRENAETMKLSRDGDDRPSGDTIFNQYINSPKAISRAEVYRDTKNLISVKKEESPA